LLRIVYSQQNVPMTKSHPVSLRLPPEVKVAAEKAAKDDFRSLSSLIEKLLTEHLRAKGYVK
jgi:hypothetical protein